MTKRSTGWKPVTPGITCTLDGKLVRLRGNGVLIEHVHNSHACDSETFLNTEQVDRGYAIGLLITSGIKASREAER